jgi:hypothetical protein
MVAKLYHADGRIDRCAEAESPFVFCERTPKMYMCLYSLFLIILTRIGGYFRVGFLCEGIVFTVR